MLTSPATCQRFGSPLNLDFHFNILLLDGAYADGHDACGQPRFKRVKALHHAEPEQLVYAISEYSWCYLEHQQLLARDTDHSYLASAKGRR